ncbi:MAG: DNA polymerase III subunit alpha [bacterium]|nr:DNA polymerase III subunit alpha [bacterium]
MDQFVHLHVHTQYSLRNGLTTVESLCARVRELGMRAIAITDYQSLAAVPELMQYAEQYDLKPIFGAQVDVGSILQESPIQNQSTISERPKHIYSLILLATNAVGFKNLVRIVNQANQLASLKKGPISISYIIQHQDGLIILSGGYKSEIAFRLRQNQLTLASEAVSQFNSLFKDKNFYLELIGENEPDREVMNAGLIALAHQYALPLVATNNVHYLTAEDAVASRLLNSMKTGVSLILPMVPDRYVKTGAEMQAIFPAAPEAVENTRWIAERCEHYHPHTVHQMPYFPVPTGYDTESYLWELCQRGLTQKYHKPTLALRQRLNEEFGLIRKKGWIDYTLLLWDICRFMRERQSQFSLDRTALSYSLVNYVLDITRLDVVKYQLGYDFYFFGNTQPYPMVEFEFDGREKDAVLAYCKNRYGAAHIGGTIQYTSNSLTRWLSEAAALLRISPETLHSILPYFSSRTKMTVESIIAQEKELARKIADNQELLLLCNAVKSLQHVYLAQEINPRLVVIARDPLFANYPLSYREEHNIYLQYPAEMVPRVKLFGIELRSQPLLAAIADTLAQVKKRHAISLDLFSFDLEDKRLFKMIRNAETVGLPHLDSSSIRSLLPELSPRNFTELLTAIALHRCGYPSGKLIADFLTGTKPNKALNTLHSATKQILHSTRGMILFKEQVYDLVKTFTGLDPRGVHEIVQHLLSKPKIRKADEIRNQFLRAGNQAGFTDFIGEKVWQFLITETGNTVTKPELIAVLELSLRCAQLKKNYPVEYFYGLLQHYESSKVRVNRYVNETKRLGITVRGPDINHSQASLILEDGALRFGLMLVNGVGEKVAENIISARGNKRYTSLFDFCRRTNPNLVTQRIIENLIRAGACDSLVRYRAQLLAILEDTVKQARHYASLDSSNTLFDVSAYTVAEESITDPYPDLEEFTLAERLAFEKQATGIYLSASPLAPYQDFLTRIGIKPICTIPRFTAKNTGPYYLAGTIAEYTTSAKKGKLNIHLYLEDDTGIIRLSLNAKQFNRYRSLIEQDRPLLVCISIERTDDRPTVTVHQLFDLSAISKQLQGTILIESKTEFNRKQLKSLYTLFRQHRGTNPVTITVAGRIRTDGFYGKLLRLKLMATPWLIQKLLSDFSPPIQNCELVDTTSLFSSTQIRVVNKQ